jgi:outer membrane protein OmpA-like peptidoglycan-associated protein
MNLINLLKDQLSGSLATQASGFLGESESNVKKALDGIFPLLLGSMINKSEENDGPQKIFDMASGMDGSILNNIGDIFGGGAGNIAKLMNSGSGVLNLLFGSKTGDIIDSITNYSGLKGSTSSSLIKMAAPFLMSMLGKQIKEKALDVMGLSTLLSSQKDVVKSNLPSGLFGALDTGFLDKAIDTISDFASEAKSKAADFADDAFDSSKKIMTDTFKSAESAVAEGNKSSGSLIKWLIPAILLLALLSFLLNKACAPADTANDALENISETTQNAADKVGEATQSLASATAAAFSKVDQTAKLAMDKIEFAAGSAGEQMKKYIDNGFAGSDKFKFNNLSFETGKASISGDTAVEVDHIAAILKTYPDIKIAVEGYTDNVGDPIANKQLSKARANAVKARLIGKDIDPSRISTFGFGDDNPIADNSTEEGRAQNRRIEIRITQ